MNEPAEPVTGQPNSGKALGPTTCPAYLRAYTNEEAKYRFLSQIRAQVGYWARVEGRNEIEKLEGLAFSILNIFDGTTVDLPSMDIVLRPHPDHEEYCKSQGEHWWPDGLVINDETHLHEEFLSPNACDSPRPD